MFVNDHISNGASDREDTSIEHDSFDDDDAEGIRIKIGADEGTIWLEHPAIDALSFYEGKECYPDQRIDIKEAAPFDLAGGTPLPETIYARCDEALNVSADAVQAAGDLVLKFLAGGSGQPIQAAKTRLVIVKEFGAADFFQTANDYIMANNAKVYTGQKDYDGKAADRVAVTVMRQEATKMEVIDTVNNVTTRLYGIREVV